MTEIRNSPSGELFDVGGGGGPTGPAGGDLDGTYPDPSVVALTTLGTRLDINSIADGEFLQRSGTSILGSSQVVTLATAATGQVNGDFGSGFTVVGIKEGGANLLDIGAIPTAGILYRSGSNVFGSGSVGIVNSGNSIKAGTGTLPTTTGLIMWDGAGTLVEYRSSGVDYRAVWGNSGILTIGEYTAPTVLRGGAFTVDALTGSGKARVQGSAGILNMFAGDLTATSGFQALSGGGGTNAQIYASPSATASQGAQVFLSETGASDCEIDNRLLGSSVLKLLVAASVQQIGFFGATPIAKPAITGSRASGAALQSLLTQGAALGLWTDSTSA